MKKKVTITLHVEAEILYKMNNPSQKQVDKKCSLSDNNDGKSPDGRIEDFTSQVYIDYDVEWKGQTNDVGYSVAIHSIEYESKTDDVNFFDTIVVGGTAGPNGTVTAKVKNDRKLAGKIDDYTIFFRIFAPDGQYKKHRIDPKLEGNN